MNDEQRKKLLQLASRYAGLPTQDSLSDSKMEELLSLLEKSSSPRCLWRLQDLHVKEDAFFTEGLCLEGETAKKMLQGCEKIILLAGTLSLEYERTLNRLQKQDMAQALLFDALGSAYIELVLDELEQEIHKRLPGWYLTDRFSCGYGDLPLSLQPELCTHLGLERSLGIYCQPSWMLVPSKSVTAMIGLSTQPVPARIRGCVYCQLRSRCSLSRKGKLCH